tara:strand:+ start:437 stop:643 length:207 start_codon:yes stop_codon:yes gene_type:complete
MKALNYNALKGMMKADTAFAVMVAEINSLDTMAMEGVIEAIQTEICLPRDISIMDLFSLWSSMDPIYV